MEYNADSRLPKKLVNFMIHTRGFDLKTPSVTQLIAPPQQTILASINPTISNIQQMVRPALGSAFHASVQGNEKRLERLHPSKKFVLTGEPDEIGYTDITGESHDDIMVDYKVTSVYKTRRVLQEVEAYEVSHVDNLLANFHDSIDWILQLSFYAFLIKDKEMDKMTGRVIAINFDSGNKRIMQSLKPPIPNNVQILDFPLLSYDNTVTYLLNQWLRLAWATDYYVHEKDVDKEAKEQIQCTNEEVWGGARCKDYCPFISTCLGVKNG